jgi:hypothetical protein
MHKETNIFINKEGDNMADTDKNINSFSDFLLKNKDKVERIAENNTVRNDKGETVIIKKDLSRKEHEWTEEYE